MNPVKDTLNVADDVVLAVIADFKSAVIQIAGTFVGTVTFEASVDGGGWSAVNAIVQIDSTVSSTTTTTGLFVIPNPGYQAVRARMSSYTSGAAVVSILGGSGSAQIADMVTTGIFLTRSGTVLSPVTAGDTLAFAGAAITAITGATGTFSGNLFGKQPVVSLTGALSSPAAAATGTLYLANKADGIAVTLPASAAGIWYDYYVQTAMSGASFTIVTPALSFLEGTVLVALEATTPAASPGPKFFSGNGTAHTTFTMNATTNGGLKGTRIRVECIDATHWAITGAVLASGIIVTPFS